MKTLLLEESEFPDLSTSTRRSEILIFISRGLESRRFRLKSLISQKHRASVISLLNCRLIFDTKTNQQTSNVSARDGTSCMDLFRRDDPTEITHDRKAHLTRLCEQLSRVVDAPDWWLSHDFSRPWSVELQVPPSIERCLRCLISLLIFDFNGSLFGCSCFTMTRCRHRRVTWKHVIVTPQC